MTIVVLHVRVYIVSHCYNYLIIYITFFWVGFQWQNCWIVGQLWVNRDSSETQGFHSLGIVTIDMWSQALWETVSNLRSCMHILYKRISWSRQNYYWKEVEIILKYLLDIKLVASWWRYMFNVMCASQGHISNKTILCNISVLLTIVLEAQR